MAIQMLQSSNPDVHYIDMSRAFGKEAGMYAGLSNAKADFYCILDADLQDPPSMIPDMLDGISNGYDVVGAARTNRAGEPPVRSFFLRTCSIKSLTRLVQRQLFRVLVTFVL